MIYIEYSRLKGKYYAAQKSYEKILDEKEELFQRTQPSGTDYSRDNVAGTKSSDQFLDYVIAKDKANIDERLSEALNIMRERLVLLESKEEELRESNDWYDRVYVLRYLENYSVYQIEHEIPYCKSQIYNMIEKIRAGV